MKKRILIDVREPEEFKSSHIEGALNIPMSEIMSSKMLEQLDKESELVLHCRSGRRSGMAKQMLESIGFHNVVDCGTLPQVARKYGARIVY